MLPLRPFLNGILLILAFVTHFILHLVAHFSVKVIIFESKCGVDLVLLLCISKMSESEDDKLILCVGMCVLDIIHVCEQYPQEDTDKRLYNTLES